MLWLGKKKKKNYVALTRPKLKKLGRSVGIFFFFFFFFFFLTYRERVEFSNIFFKVSKWGKLGRNAVKTHVQVMQVLFKPLNTTFSKFFAQIWHKKKKKKKKKTRPCFFAFYGRSGEGNINIFFLWPYGLHGGAVLWMWGKVKLEKLHTKKSLNFFSVLMKEFPNVSFVVMHSNININMDSNKLVHGKQTNNKQTNKQTCMGI